MSARLIINALTVAAALSASSSFANQHVFVRGPYVAAAGGLSVMPDADYSATGGGVTTEFDNGFGVSGALGYRTGKIWRRGGLRIEAEGSYNRNKAGGNSGAGAPAGPVSGEAESFTGTVNLYHDFEFFFFDKNLKWVTPYLGAGIGYTNVNYDGISSGGVTLLDADDSAPAYQFIAGFSWTAGYNTDLTFDYRYVNAPDMEAPAPGGGIQEIDAERHMFNAGLRYRFWFPGR